MGFWRGRVDLQASQPTQSVDFAIITSILVWCRPVEELSEVGIVAVEDGLWVGVGGPVGEGGG